MVPEQQSMSNVVKEERNEAGVGCPSSLVLARHPFEYIDEDPAIVHEGGTLYSMMTMGGALQCREAYNLDPLRGSIV